MSTEQVGAYMLLLCKSWREKPPGSLPSDDSLLAKWARVSLDRWLEIRSGVLAPYTFGTDSRWHQKRQRVEYDKYMARRRECAKAGKASANKRFRTTVEQPFNIPVLSSSPIKDKNKNPAANPAAAPQKRSRNSQEQRQNIEARDRRLDTEEIVRREVNAGRNWISDEIAELAKRKAL